jgi:GMP synthase-like glutamine amidotransferase
MIVIIDNTVDEAKAMYLPLLKRYLSSQGYPYVVCKSLASLKRIDMKKVTGAILSGSPLMVKTKDFANNIDQFILNVYTILMLHDVPIMGICYGCQLINKIYGGTLQKLKKPFCDNTTVRGIPTRFCCSYILKEIPASFVPLAEATIEGITFPCMIKHKHRPLYGCLFHPEFHDKTHYLLKAFLNLTMKSKVSKNKF